ncbi:hypothetical protein J6590_004413 [Homalodisca vitripennis]|nr:hypothetical protein J6590_004413 [Homalodisca vitripennis]
MIDASRDRGPGLPKVKGHLLARVGRESWELGVARSALGVALLALSRQWNSPSDV